jgi:hypothetical protein
MMPAMTATRSTTGAASAEELVWLRPERGFESRLLRQELDAADSLLSSLQRELAAERERCLSVADTAAQRSSVAASDARPTGRPAQGRVLPALLALGIVVLLVGAGMVLGSLAGDRDTLWNWGLAVMVTGQTAVLLASLADRSSATRHAGSAP